jgi:hypothetical protein
LRCGCRYFVFEEPLVVTQLDDRCILGVRQEIIVQIQIQIPLAFLRSL